MLQGQAYRHARDKKQAGWMHGMSEKVTALDVALKLTGLDMCTHEVLWTIKVCVCVSGGGEGMPVEKSQGCLPFVTCR